MMEQVNTYEREVYAAMAEDKPLKTYIKTILGKVYVTVLNPFSGKPEPVELYGQPEASNPKAVLQIWSTKEDLFFNKMNREHLEAGNMKVLSVADATKPAPVSPNAISDGEIVEILNKPFLALKNRLNKFTTVAPVYRFLRAAEEMEKSEKILDSIRARMSELQLGEEPSEEEAE
jgi:hypothetical protein